MLLNPHISAYARCLAGKVCGLVRPTWGASLGEDKLAARDRILNTKVVCQANTPPFPGGQRGTIARLGGGGGGQRQQGVVCSKAALFAMGKPVFIKCVLLMHQPLAKCERPVLGLNPSITKF